MSTNEVVIEKGFIKINSFYNRLIHGEYIIDKNGIRAYFTIYKFVENPENCKFIFNESTLSVRLFFLTKYMFSKKKLYRPIFDINLDWPKFKEALGIIRDFNYRVEIIG